MKKILLVALFAVMAIGASAQNGFRVWYGLNIAGSDADGVKSELKPLNIGVDYTAAINETFDWAAGLSYQTKGSKEWDPGYIQLEGNGSWNFVKNDDVKVGIFTGPYVGFLVAKDDAEDTKSIDFGWQGGVQGYYKKVSLKIGYGYGFLDVSKAGDSKPYQIFFRLGYTF